MATQKIMVISPDRYQAGRIVTCLSEAGYQAASIDTGEAALDELCRQSPDLLLVIWERSDSDTLRLASGIGEDGCLSNAPLILMGAELTEEDVLIALDAGADQCWREPFNPRVLVARVHAFLRRGKTNESLSIS